MLGLRYAAPHPALADYVSAFYLFESDETDIAEIERADIAQLRFTLAGEGHIHFGNGSIRPIHPVCLIGPRNQASRIVAKGPARVFGMGLLPAGWLAVARCPAFKLADQTADGLALDTGPLADAQARILEAVRFEEMIAAAEDYLSSAVSTIETPSAWLIRAVNAWLESSVDPDVQALLETTGLSHTQAQRQLKALFGAPPKLLARKYRALRIARRIAEGQANWKDYIGDAFCDQSHCIREIKHFTGITPAAIKHAPRLTQATFSRAELRGKITSLSADI